MTDIAVTFRLGMAQMLVEPGEPEANLARAEARIAEAARQRCRIVVLPECLDLGWTDPSARNLAQPIPGAHADRLARAARTHGLWVVAGLVERAGTALYNAAVMIDPDGERRLLHRKINELEIAHDLYTTGDRLGVARTEFGTVGLNICADNFESSLDIGHTLGRMGASLLVSPCAWAVDADHDNASDPYGGLWRRSYGELSRRHGMTVVGVSNIGPITGGPWAGRKCIGCSLAIGPGVETQGPYDEEALIAIDLAGV